MNSKFLAIGALTFGMLLGSCSNDDDNNVGSNENNLKVSINGIEPLGDDFEYEGWIIVDEKPVSTGIFDVAEGKKELTKSFTVDADQLAKATAFVLSIEPTVDTDPAPSATKMFKADFSGNEAAIIANLVPGLGSFTDVAGKYFLRTPTDETGTNNGNDENGIWFGIPGTMPPAPGFTGMPELDENSGWVYEGWVVTENGPISTGTFTKFSDRDSSNMFSGTQANAGPPAPGEDFFLNSPRTEDIFPLDLRGKTVVISLEPADDNSPAPFSIKPLLSTIAQETAPAVHDFGANLGTFPSGTITRK